MKSMLTKMPKMVHIPGTVNGLCAPSYYNLKGAELKRPEPKPEVEKEVYTKPPNCS